MPFRAQHERTSRKAYYIGFLLIGVAIALDFAIGRTQGLTGAYILPPFILAALSSTRRTVVMAMLSLTAYLMMTYIYNDPAPRYAAEVRTVFAFIIAGVAPWLAMIREQYERRLASLSAVAEVAQRAILTPIPKRSGPYNFTSSYISAAAESHVGGDLVGLVPCGDHQNIIVGDVRGKGLGAVRLSALTLAIFRETASSTVFPCGTVNSIEERISPWLGDEDFITAALASLSNDGAMSIAVCGHPSPLLVKATGEWGLLDVVADSPFGLDPRPVVSSFTLEPGDRVLFYTDGLIEARARRGGFVPLESSAGGLGVDTFDTALDGVLGRLMAATGHELDDDLAMLLVEYAPTE